MAKVCMQTIEHDGVYYRKVAYQWQVQMFGTYGPSCNGRPSHRFVPIPDENVPREVRAL